MTDAKGAPAPFSLPLFASRLRDDALLNQAVAAFQSGHFAEALLACEYACRRFPDQSLPALLRAKILQHCQPGLAAKAWYAAWCCDPLAPTLQDALLRAWIEAGAAASAAELGTTFLPERCRAGNQDSLLALLRAASTSTVGACWRNGAFIEARIHASAPVGVTPRVRLLISDGQQEFQTEVAADGSLVRVTPPRPHGVWSLALAAAPGASAPLLPGSPVVFDSPLPAAPAAVVLPAPNARGAAARTVTGPALAAVAGRRHAARADRTPRPVAIVIPVYRGQALVQACLDSVFASLPLNRTATSVVVVDDASPEPALSAWLDSLAQAGRIQLLRNHRNLGFIESVNRGMRAQPERDVLLLNADTLVHGDWIDRLMAALYSAPDVAATTPWSNNGEISSFPGIADAAPPPTAPQLAAIDQAAAALRRAGATADIELPACCGFTLLMRRRVLDEIGLFDGAELVRGYSEEVDWCQRARAAGWRHLAATGVFVAHVGTVSFRFEKTLRVRQNRSVIAARYPGFYDEYQTALRTDLLAAPRAQLEQALAASAPDWLRAARLALDGSGEFARPLPAALPQAHARVGVWRLAFGSAEAQQVLALARVLASAAPGQPTPRLLVLGDVSEALWRTGVVDGVPLSPLPYERTLISDPALVGLAGCSALLGSAGQAAPLGIPYTVLDAQFDPHRWLAGWRRQHGSSQAFDSKAAA